MPTLSLHDALPITCAWVRRNFSLWPAGRCEGEEAAEGRKCEGGAGNGSGRASVHDTNLRSVGEQNRCQVGPTILFECPAPDPPLLPSIIFPLGHARAFISMTMPKIVNNEIILDNSIALLNNTT